MERPTWAPAQIDIERPSAARVYDYILGGAHNFEIDRAVADRAIAAAPEIPYAARTHREFLERAVRFLVERGVHQFLDLGSGIPTARNTHEIATEAFADTRVVYVDHDPVAVAHSQAILSDDPRHAVLMADMRDAAAVLGSQPVRSKINFSRPVGLLLLAVLHFFPDADDPYGVVDTYTRALGSGSYVAVSHVTDALAAEPDVVFNETTRQPEPVAVLRTPAEIARFFTGLDLVEPGLVPPPLWRPDGPVDAADRLLPGLVGVARKP